METGESDKIDAKGPLSWDNGPESARLSKDIAADVVRLAEKHGVLDRLLFIGRTISEPQVRKEIMNASSDAHAAAVANNPDEFSRALGATNADWVYFRYLPPKEQIEAVHQAGKRAFIAGPTVAGDLPDNWRQAADVGINAILTDYPLRLSAMLRTEATGADKP